MQQSKPGRKKKCQTRTGRPRAPPAYSDHFNNLRPGPTIDKGNIHQFTALSNTADVKCRLCNQLLDNAVETPCMHLFCCECLIVHFKDAGQSIPCPTCQAPVHYRNVTSPREYFASLYSSLAMQCTVCNILVTLGDVKLHICRGVPRPSLRHVDQPVSMHDHRYASQLPNDAISTVDQSILTHDHGYATTAKPPSDVVRILHRPLTAPVTPQMEELGTHILKTKLAQTEDRFLVKYKTGGLPLTLVCIPQARKSSKDAASLSVRNRSKILDKIRGLLSMDAKELQQQDELKLSSMKDELESILKDLKLNSIRIPAMKLLAVKTHLGISWTRIRELKKWLKGYNILTEGENVLRRQQNEVIADNLITDSLPLSFRDEIDGGVVIQQAPYVGVKCLVAKIKQQLDQYQKYQELTWHEGTIPHDEIWVKIGGDKGGGTFKQMIQIGNVKHPNSLRHTIIMSVFAGEDTRDNLKTGLQRFRLQVPELQSSSWQGCKFRLFMFGDYEYICRVYGITGANGRHCCLYCDITKDGMRLPLAERPALQQRSLETLTYDLQRFRVHGAHLTKAKEFNNVIDEPMFAIPLTQVCPPGLHISLGLYLKHFNSFEGACHDLDMEVAAVLAEKDHEEWDSQVLGSRYQTLISVLKQARCLEQQARALDEELKLMEEQLTDTILTSEEESTDMQDYISATTKLVKRQKKLFEEANALRDQAALKPGQGPLAGQLDITLQEFRVKRQAFDGKSFVGNHVHKCCKKENIKLLTDALVIKTQQVCASLVPAAASIAAKYAQLFHLFGTCHRMYNSASLLDDSAIDALDQAIKDYMNFFRGEFPSESIPPKMHLLEDHVMPWIRRWGFGLGFHGEQGGESVHSHFNCLRRDVRGISAEVDILKSVVKSQWIMTSPAHAPPITFK
ncbi:uncharacterized protein LOC119723080 isoform X2 [Patiria miniata]|nr:uncharacterized protein LOC119723080 isoform X2 [Patiria miniata]